MANTLGGTFETKEPALNELLKEIEAGFVQLPDFQRRTRAFGLNDN